MKLKRKLAAVLLAAVTVFGALSISSFAEDEDSSAAVATEVADGFEIVKIEDSKGAVTGVQIVGYTGSETEIVIPTGIDGIAVTGFTISSDRITKVEIADGFTAIPENAFAGCTVLKSVAIPKSVTNIGRYAFHNCSALTSIVIPDGVTHIGGRAFGDCTALTSVTIPGSVVFMDGVFHGCTALAEITLPEKAGFRWFGGFSKTALTEVTIPAGVRSIGGQAFKDCKKLTSVVIPDGVKSINGAAFSNCIGLTEITLPDSVNFISKSAFSGCDSLSVTYKGKQYTAANRNELYLAAKITY